MTDGKYTKYTDFKLGYKSWGDPDPNFNDEEWPTIETDPGKSLAKSDYSKFKIITNHLRWVLLESRTTRQRKWVDLQVISKEGVPSAFYDADMRFRPEGLD